MSLISLLAVPSLRGLSVTPSLACPSVANPITLPGSSTVFFHYFPSMEILTELWTSQSLVVAL